MFKRKKQTLKFLSLHTKLKFHFLQIDCTIPTSVQASFKRGDHVTTLNTKQSRQVEALGATPTGPENRLMPSWLLRFFTEFGVLRDYSRFIRLLTWLFIQGDGWATNITKFNSHVSVMSIMSVCPKFSSSVSPLPVRFYDSAFELNPRALHEYKTMRIDSLASNPAWMVPLHCRAISGLVEIDKNLVGKGWEEVNTEKVDF